MAQSITGRLTVILSDVPEFNINLDTLTNNPDISIVSQDENTKTIVFDINIQGA